MIYLLALPIMGVFCQRSVYSGSSFEVIDGDTIIFRGARIRLLGIDAPELSQRSSSGARIGEWARARLKKLISGHRISIVLSHRGFYGRWLGVIFKDGVNINAQLIHDGVAWSYGKKFIQYEILARKKKKGIWKLKHHLSPQKFRKITRRR